MDAYDGTVTYYADLTEPIIQAWSNAVPDMFTPMESASLSLQAHFRYPENLFQVQANQFANYHVDRPVGLLPEDAIAGRSPTIPPSPANDDDTDATRRRAGPLHPYYLIMRLPGEEEASSCWSCRSCRRARQNLVAWMAAKSDPG